MTRTPPRPIRRLQARSPLPFVARIPGSKSCTNRALVLAASRLGTTAIPGALDSDDTRRLAAALGAFGGLRVTQATTGFTVERTQRQLSAPTHDLDLAGAGTPARLLLAFAATAAGRTVITGNQRLRERPMADMLDALRALGIRCESLQAEGCLPVAVHGGEPNGSEWRVQAGVSSQFTSALLLLASQQSRGPITLWLEGAQPSRPYVELTRAMLRACGIRTERAGDDRIVVQPGPVVADRIPVEVDASSMSYFLALAAVTGTTVEVPGIGRGSAQGDVGFAEVLGRMGCKVRMEADRIAIAGGPLRGIDVDLGAMPDVALTLAALAACAAGPTRITNIGSLRVKESDRIDAAARALERLGQRVEAGSDWLAIHPTGVLRPALVPTHDDHRVAMAFSVPGLCADGVAIEDPDCVGKSFPGYWQEFDRFCRHHAGSR